MKFSELFLNEDLQRGIDGAGYTECTPVQQQVLQVSLEGRDLYVQSQTGTGKTAAYLVTIIQQMIPLNHEKVALVMAPTRELAVQIQEEAMRLCRFTALTCESFFGGVGYDKQIAALKKGCDIIVGTPGRVIDLNQGGQMDLSRVAFLVIDEADRMFDMGFYPDLRTLIKVLPPSAKRQTMLFSATLNSYVKNLAWEYTKNPFEIAIEPENVTVDEIDQRLFHVSSGDKMRLLLGIMEREKAQSTLVFCNTKKTCEIVSKRLRLNGIENEYIIGDLPQKKRLAIMDKFKAGKVSCLVATDVAARGIDVSDLQLVINYDLPNEAENYVHRIGRTARAGKSGKAVSFCSEQDVYSLLPIERYVGKSIPSEVAEQSLLVDDKSANVYIQLEEHRESYGDKSDFGRKRAREWERQGRRGKRGGGRYSERNREAQRSYRRDRRVFDEDALQTMTSDERMRVYKERYGKGFSAATGEQGTQGRQGREAAVASGSKQAASTPSSGKGKRRGAAVADNPQRPEASGKRRRHGGHSKADERKRQSGFDNTAKVSRKGSGTHAKQALSAGSTKGQEAKKAQGDVSSRKNLFSRIKSFFGR